jgi:Domain of unknown function (DUF4169)
MPDPINLRQARKARARIEQHMQAAQNRAKFGRTKAERQREAATDALNRSQLDAKKLDVPAAPPTTGDKPS